MSTAPNKAVPQRRGKAGKSSVGSPAKSVKDYLSFRPAPLQPPTPPTFIRAESHHHLGEDEMTAAYRSYVGQYKIYLASLDECRKAFTTVFLQGGHFEDTPATPERQAKPAGNIAMSEQYITGANNVVLAYQRVGDLAHPQYTGPVQHQPAVPYRSIRKPGLVAVASTAVADPLKKEIRKKNRKARARARKAAARKASQSAPAKAAEIIEKSKLVKAEISYAKVLARKDQVVNKKSASPAVAKAPAPLASSPKAPNRKERRRAIYGDRSSSVNK